MDQNQTKQHHIQTLDHRVTQFHFSKKSIRIIFSISVFSLLFSCFPLLIWLSHFINKMSMHLASYTRDRLCIFLFCNGILVFLIRNSILPRTSPPATDSNFQQSVPELAEKKELSVEEVEQNHDTERQTLEEEEEIGLSSTGELNKKCDDFIEEEEEEEIGLLSTEELNKKCDDFIRKMREGIKIEAQKLIMV